METPPHAWGRRFTIGVGAHELGNTPTCVGKTGITIPVVGRRKKHPHMRGEDYMYADTVILDAETPPHAWGRLALASKEQLNAGNTPTCVGKT